MNRARQKKAGFKFPPLFLVFILVAAISLFNIRSFANQGFGDSKNVVNPSVIQTQNLDVRGRGEYRERVVQKPTDSQQPHIRGKTPPPLSTRTLPPMEEPTWKHKPNIVTPPVVPVVTKNEKPKNTETENPKNAETANPKSTDTRESDAESKVIVHPSSTVMTDLSSSFKIARADIEKAIMAMKIASSRNMYGDFALLQVLDKGFVEMTKHWICNVRRMGDTLGMTVFVATDEEAKSELLKFDRDLRVVLVPHVRNPGSAELSYGQVAYYELMKFRTELMLRLLGGGVTVMLVEADAYWARNVVEDIVALKWPEDSYDMISASDQVDQENLQGGFQINRPTDKSVHLWAELFTRMQAIITRLEDRHGKGSTKFVAEEGSEQLLMQALTRSLGKDIGFKLRYLPTLVVASGQWYQGKKSEKYPNPAVILNNWMVGNGNKVDRAIKWGHFFFSKETGKCMDPDTKRSKTFRATITILTMARAGPFQRLLNSIEAADYSPHEAGATNDVKLVIKVDKPAAHKMAKYGEGYAKVLEIAKSFKSQKFSSIELELNSENVGLKYQWFDSFKEPRGWDEMGVVFEDDLEVSPHYFRYLRWHWLNHGYDDPNIGSISLQRQTLQATAGGSIPIVNNHRPFLYRLIGTWGLSMKPSSWLEFIRTYRHKNDVLIPGLITSEWQKTLHKTMWSQHFIHFLYKRDQFTQFINLPDGTTLCANWQEDGEHYNSGNPKKDFDIYMGPYDPKVLEVYDTPMNRYDFSTKRIE